MAVFMLVSIFLAATKLSAAKYCDEDDEGTFSYHGSENGPRQWSGLFQACNGHMQSPVNIQTTHMKKDQSLKKLKFFGYDSAIERGEFINNGHTVMITPRDNVQRGINIQGQKYQLVQLHFHWGSDKNPGSEHTVNQHRFEMEIHFVHANPHNKIAVVGVLVTIGNEDNKAFKPILEVLPNILYKGESTTFRSSLNLNKLLPESPASFYGYFGSLTTPMCTEGVTWFVLQKGLTIGWKQLNSFLKVSSVDYEDRCIECLLSHNNRPVQSLNGRIIYVSQ